MSGASFSSNSSTPDRLIAGDMQLVPRTITVLSGQNLVRGTVIGKKTTAGTITVTADSGNTGTGTVGSASVSGRAKLGRYRLVCIEPASNAGTFALFDPDGNEV